MSIKFANIAKIGAIVVVGGILVLNTKSCIEGHIELDERKKRALEGKNNSTSSSDTMTQPTTLDYNESRFLDDYRDYVNSNVYSILVSAKDKYEDLLNNGEFERYINRVRRNKRKDNEEKCNE